MPLTFNLIFKDMFALLVCSVHLIRTCLPSLLATFFFLWCRSCVALAGGHCLGYLLWNNVCASFFLGPTVDAYVLFFLILKRISEHKGWRNTAFFSLYTAQMVKNDSIATVVIFFLLVLRNISYYYSHLMTLRLYLEDSDHEPFYEDYTSLIFNELLFFAAMSLYWYFLSWE